MLFTLEKGDMFEVSMASVECIVGKSDGSTFLILMSGNVLPKALMKTISYMGKNI